MGIIWYEVFSDGTGNDIEGSFGIVRDGKPKPVWDWLNKDLKP